MGFLLLDFLTSVGASAPRSPVPELSFPVAWLAASILHSPQLLLLAEVADVRMQMLCAPFPTLSNFVRSLWPSSATLGCEISELLSVTVTESNTDTLLPWDAPLEDGGHYRVAVHDWSIYQAILVAAEATAIQTPTTQPNALVHFELDLRFSRPQRLLNDRIRALEQRVEHLEQQLTRVREDRSRSRSPPWRTGGP